MSEQSYYQPVEFGATLRGQAVQVATKPGFPNWEQITPAAALLADSVVTPPDARILHLGCGNGGLSVLLARGAPRGEVLLLDASCVATAMAERTLALNRVDHARVLGDPPELADVQGRYTVAVLEIPAGRKFARRWLALAHAALEPGGQLYLAGPKAEGIEALVGDARALFGAAATLAYRNHNRVAVATKAAGNHQFPDWAVEPGIAPGTWHHFELAVGDELFAIDSLPGIFSYDRLDDGTAMLLAALAAQPGQARHAQQHGRVLDIGCGYGIIGLAVARSGAAQVDLVDVSVPAVAAARRNIAAAGLANARARPSDAYSALGDERYDLIVTNPPFHAGKRIDYDAAQAFIGDARRHLAPRGRFILVANGFIRYERAMRDAFGGAEMIAGDRRYQVLQATVR